MNYHKKISYIKSVLRIFGYSLFFLLSFKAFAFGLLYLITAEILGIAEEWKE